MAPAIESMPPTIHARYTSLAEPTACIISAGTRKMPLPMMVPTTIAVACQTFKSRNSSGLCSVACIELPALRIGDHQAHQVADDKSRGRAKRYIPGPGDMRALPQVAVQRQSAEHTSNRAWLRSPARENAQQEHAEQPSVGDRGEAEAGFQNPVALSRSQGEGKQHDSPYDRCG